MWVVCLSFKYLSPQRKPICLLIITDSGLSNCALVNESLKTSDTLSGKKPSKRKIPVESCTQYGKKKIWKQILKRLWIVRKWFFDNGLDNKFIRWLSRKCALKNGYQTDCFNKCAIKRSLMTWDEPCLIE